MQRCGWKAKPGKEGEMIPSGHAGVLVESFILTRAQRDKRGGISEDHFPPNKNTPERSPTVKKRDQLEGRATKSPHQLHEQSGRERGQTDGGARSLKGWLNARGIWTHEDKSRARWVTSPLRTSPVTGNQRRDKNWGRADGIGGTCPPRVGGN